MAAGGRSDLSAPTFAGVRRLTKGQAEVMLITTCPALGRWDTMNELAEATRIVAAEKKLQSVQVEDDNIMLKRPNDYLMTPGRFTRLTSSSPDARLDELKRHLTHLH
jgi:hypothetical protein